tara:strand:- start:33 stop:371 length:339 start_codon:yes stop_codon:yes gene_type:complete
MTLYSPYLHFGDFNSFARITVTYMEDWSKKAQKRILLALDACAGLKDDSEKRFRLWQTLETALWEFPEAVEMGFKKFVTLRFAERQDALQYHDRNCVHSDCTICDLMDKWCK